MITANEIHWLAGLLEGEGSFYIGGGSRLRKSGHGTIRVFLGMTDRDVVTKAAALLGSRVIEKIRKAGPGHYKTPWITQVSGQSAAGWMMILWLLLGERRRQQIQKAIAWWRTRPLASRDRRNCSRGHPFGQISIPGRKRRCQICNKEAQPHLTIVQRERRVRRRATRFKTENRQQMILGA